MRGNQAKLWARFLLLMLFVTNGQLTFSLYKKLPDLTVSDLRCDTAAKVGAAIQNVVAELVNQGKRPAAAFRLKYFLSSDANFSADDVDTGAVCEFAGLGRGETVKCTVAVPVPHTFMPGQYFLIASVDDQNSIAERDETNNVKAFGPITIEKAKDDDGNPPPPPQGIIKVDGDPEDWQGIAPLYTDAVGDGPFDSSGQYQAGSDITHISVTNDNRAVYFLIEFAGAPYSGGLTLFFDTDVNPTTGCNGSETVLFSPPAEPHRLAYGDFSNCELTESFPGVVTSATKEKAGHSYVEAAINIEDLFRLTPGRRDFRFYAKTALTGVADEVWPPTVYSLTAHYADGANLQIRFHPETVLPDNARPCGAAIPGWYYGVTLTETAGVGVTISSYKIVLYDSNGGYLMTIGTYSGSDFARYFTDCGSASDHLNPLGTACSQSLCVNLGGRNAGQLDITFSGTDDKGYAVRFTSPRLILVSR
ncbi:MAG: hypothetical protein HY231_19785 [Acidobacteria bacterium]|nr:hypothetical protein [Acidobacteriota bacterium]